MAEPQTSGSRAYTELELNDSLFLDATPIAKDNRTKGFVYAIFLSFLGVFFYFIPVNIDGKMQNLFGWAYGNLMDLAGVYGLWFCCFLTIITTIGCFMGKYISKEGEFLHRIFKDDSKFHPYIYLLGMIYMVVFMFDLQFSWYSGPEFIVSPAVGGTIIAGFIPGFLWVIPLSAITLPLLLNYGGIDFVGTLLEPIMRKGYDVPGKSAVDAVSSFLASSSVAVLITNNLYRQRVYTEKEAVIITTGFSAVSVGFSAVVIGAVDMGHDFTRIFFICMFMAFAVTAICRHLPPISKKREVYVDGTPQKMEEKHRKYTDGKNVLYRAADRAAKKAYFTGPSNYMKYGWSNLLQAFVVVPKITTLASAAGVTALILAEYTTLFTYIGYLFQPLLTLLNVEAAGAAASALPTGLAEMYLPVLLIKDQAAELGEGVRFLVASVSIVQMIFFSETASLQLGLKMPIKAWELVIIFFERTFIAIPIAAIFMHLLY